MHNIGNISFCNVCKGQISSFLTLLTADPLLFIKRNVNEYVVQLLQALLYNHILIKYTMQIKESRRFMISRKVQPALLFVDVLNLPQQTPEDGKLSQERKTLKI
jgi:hypothetical protein